MYDIKKICKSYLLRIGHFGFNAKAGKCVEMGIRV